MAKSNRIHHKIEWTNRMIEPNYRILKSNLIIESNDRIKVEMIETVGKWISLMGERGTNLRELKGPNNKTKVSEGREGKDAT